MLIPFLCKNSTDVLFLILSYTEEVINILLTIIAAIFNIGKELFIESTDHGKSNIAIGNILEQFRIMMPINKDKAIQYTSVGVHKDDLLFNIDAHPIKKFGSQGQQKSFLIALKLAQFDFIKQQSGVNPILLLDDIFDKLDEERVTQIIKLVDDENFGQLFISDTHADRTEKAIKQVHQSYEIFKL